MRNDNGDIRLDETELQTLRLSLEGLNNLKESVKKAISAGITPDVTIEDINEQIRATEQMIKVYGG